MDTESASMTDQYIGTIFASQKSNFTSLNPRNTTEFLMGGSKTKMEIRGKSETQDPPYRLSAKEFDPSIIYNPTNALVVKSDILEE